MVSRTMGGFTINIIDTPGLVEAGYVNHQALELIKGSVTSILFNSLICINNVMDDRRMSSLDSALFWADTLGLASIN